MNGLAKLFLAAGLALSLAACQTPGPYGQSGINKQQIGTVTGGVLGGVLGSQVGGGSGRVIAGIGGALIGGLLGSSVGASLDRSDEERAYAALENNRTDQASSWRNPDSGSNVVVTPTRTYTGDGGQVCREYDTRVDIDGRREDAHGSACRERDGSWRIVN